MVFGSKKEKITGRSQIWRIRVAPGLFLQFIGLEANEPVYCLGMKIVKFGIPLGLTVTQQISRTTRDVFVRYCLL